MKKIAVLTSGGDSPGMNACIRAIVHTALHHQLEVVGVMHGYTGLINNSFIPLNLESVSGIIQRGGTILKTSRCNEFLKLEGRQTALKNLKENNIDGLIGIGGDGTFKGAMEFSKISDIPFIGCPGTIDNDLLGTDFTIGYDTAINTVVEAVDKIRDTAESHDGLFIVEAMGRDAGLIALRSGIATGAEAILIPETKTDIDKLIKRLGIGKVSKSSKIIIVAEGDDAGGAYKIEEEVKKRLPKFDIHVTILGHIQRGGRPSAMDRVYSSRMGYSAVEALVAGHKNVMIGIVDKKITQIPFEKAVKHNQRLDPDLLKMVEILSL